ncbi:glycosyltransferase [candidate division KSB1 bacterium]|nr:glycosyltransferase [candidate division KSB1 bacterium]RQW06150.1 MAG: glycosyltransferase [candidate division KSB1 bacterium]
MYRLLYISCLSVVFYGIFILIVRYGLFLVQQNNILQHDLPFVSIVVAVRNKSNTVLKCLNALVHQDYPRHLYEIIVVDDASSDCTHERLPKFCQKNKINLLHNPVREKYKSSKKTALELAVATSRADILLFADADCFPPSSWIRGMIRHFDKTVGFVAGFSPQTTDHKLARRIMEIDAASAAIVSAATIGFGRGVTCTGRNLAYRKKALQDIGGFAALPDSLSGDDDFVLQAVSRHPSWRVAYALDQNAAVPAAGPNNLRRFLQQKKRHLSAGKYFPPSVQLSFAVYHALNLLLWAVTFIGVWTMPLLCFPFAFKLLFDYSLLRFFLAQFNMTFHVRDFIFWQVLFIFYNAVIGPIAMLTKIKW